MILTGQQIADELKTFGVREIVGPWYPSYFVPHSQWLEEFNQWWSTNILPERKFDEFNWNCISYSMEYRVEASKSIIGTGITGATPAVFLAKVFLSIAGNQFGFNTGDHCTSIVRTEDSGWLWSEPQAGRSIDLRTALDGGDLTLDLVL